MQNNTNFTNSDTRLFYSLNSFEYISLDIFEKSGLDSNCDLNLLKNIFKRYSTFTEIGAGKGRVIGYLVDVNPYAQITAYEWHDEFFSVINKEYKENKNITLHQKNILEVEEFNQTEVSLFLFSFLAEFNPEEQEYMVKKIAKYTQNYMIIDLPNQNASLTGIWRNKHLAYLTSPQVSVPNFIADQEIIEGYIKETNFFLEKIQEYETPTQRVRKLYFLKRV